MKRFKRTTRRRCLVCLTVGLLAAAAVFVAVTSRRGPEAGPMPEVPVQARHPEGLLPEVLVRAASPDAAASVLPGGRE